jgi:hypothetical protein
MSPIILIFIILIFTGVILFFRFTDPGRKMFCPACPVCPTVSDCPTCTSAQKIGFKYKPSTNKIATQAAEVLNDTFEEIRLKGPKCGSTDTIIKFTDGITAGMKCSDVKAYIISQIPDLFTGAYKESMEDFAGKLSTDACKSDGTIDMKILQDAEQAFCSNVLCAISK